MTGVCIEELIEIIESLDGCGLAITDAELLRESVAAMADDGGTVAAGGAA